MREAGAGGRLRLWSGSSRGLRDLAACSARPRQEGASAWSKSTSGIWHGDGSRAKWKPSSIRQKCRRESGAETACRGRRQVVIKTKMSRREDVTTKVKARGRNRRLDGESAVWGRISGAYPESRRVSPVGNRCVASPGRGGLLGEVPRAGERIDKDPLAGVFSRVETKVSVVELRPQCCSHAAGGLLPESSSGSIEGDRDAAGRLARAGGAFS